MYRYEADIAASLSVYWLFLLTGFQLAARGSKFFQLLGTDLIVLRDWQADWFRGEGT